MDTLKIQPVVLAGGSGTRLWPISRGDYPKQLLQLDDELTMLQRTAVRLNDTRADDVEIQVRTPIVVCGEDLRFLVAQQLNDISHAPSILLEPVARNTAPAIAAAAQLVGTDDPDTVLVVMPSDHIIADSARFCRAAAVAARACAAAEIIATFGVRPTRAETGFGYIQRGAERSGEVFELARFVEKPDAGTAEHLVADGQHFWNAGIFVARAGTLTRAVAALAPDIHRAVEGAVAARTADGQFLRLGKDEFAASPSDSIDFAVMEKLRDAACGIEAVVVPLDAEWSDVGSWEALLDVLERDDAGNVSRGDVVAIDSRDCVHLSTSRLVTTLGAEGLVVVETPDAVFVAPKSQSQRVRDVVAELNAQQRTEASSHRKVYRPWGTFESLDTGERYQVKRLTVNPGATLSLQLHYHRAEHWVVVRGTAKVTRDEETFLLSENESTYLPLGATHRLENPGKVPLEVIEVQSGSYLGEDDIVRFEDVYKRE
ncbi:MAG: mannose-1-phosphate guanylyltransferase/mannose-6-phosphate isomerase [Pseudomonadota bacterium]